MARELNLYVDSERGALVSGFTSTIPATLAPFKFGDSVPVICRVLTPDTSSSIRPYKEFDLTGRELRLGIGVPAGLPTVGTFTLTYGANTTAAIAFDADASAVQTALNALASITSAGGVTVTKPNDGAYRIVFNTAGDRTAISGDTSSLYPTTGAFIGVAQQGTGSLKEIVVISLETQPAAYVLLEDELPTAAIGVTVVRSGGSGIGEIQTIDLSSPEPYDGTFSLEIDGNSTPAIAYNALADEVQSAIESASEDYVGEVTVTGTFPRYTISFGSTLGALGAMTADASDLVVPKGRKGSLNLNTTGVIELLNGEASATAKLEIEILDLDDSTPWTVIQQDVTVNQDVIPNSPASQTPLPTYPTTDEIPALVGGIAVRFDEEQDLSGNEQETGRSNIGALAASAKEHTIITAGDSVLSRNALGDAFYMDRLAARSERFRNATLVDGGVPGSLILTTEGTIEDLLEPYANPPEQTKLIVLLGTAINDITSGRTAAQALASMQACCDLIRAAGGLCAAFSCPGTFAFQSTIDDYNELLRAAYADGDFDFLIDIARIPYTVTDYVHPDAAGCELIADELLRALGGFPLAAPDSFQLGLKTSLSIATISAAASAVVTVTGHGLTTGQVVHITGSNSTPVIDGIRKVTVTGANTFTVPVTTTVAGTTGAVNTATALLASDIQYDRQHTWLLQTLNDNANGANAEVFLATGGYNAGATPFSLKLHSIAFFNGGAGESSPIFDSGYIQTHPTLAFYLVNKSASYTYKVFPTLLGRAID